MHSIIEAVARPASFKQPVSGREGSYLTFMTCGSVDDGKSTLIGRLLYDTERVMDDHLATLREDSRRYRTGKSDLDFALLVDGLHVERAHGITIDVAYRFLTTERRRFVIADAPGHVQYTRNMATAASNADVAVVLIDVRRGATEQTRRHSFIAQLLGIPHIVLAVNKMDLVSFQKADFERAYAAYRDLVEDLSFHSVTAIPIAARFGDNVVRRSEQTIWYEGPTLLDYLETVETRSVRAARPFRMPVQLVNRADQRFRGYAGTVAMGAIQPDDPVVVAGSARLTKVNRILTGSGEVAEAVAGDAITLVLDDGVEASRGDVICAAGEPCRVSSRFEGYVLWLGEKPMTPDTDYLFKHGASIVAGRTQASGEGIDLATGRSVAANALHANEVGRVALSLTRGLAFEPYDLCRELGGFIVIDPLTNNTVGVGTIEDNAPTIT
jgi:bifunctional enzyme CysN/CysC